MCPWDVPGLNLVSDVITLFYQGQGARELVKGRRRSDTFVLTRWGMWTAQVTSPRRGASKASDWQCFCHVGRQAISIWFWKSLPGKSSRMVSSQSSLVLWGTQYDKAEGGRERGREGGGDVNGNRWDKMTGQPWDDSQWRTGAEAGTCSSLSVLGEHYWKSRQKEADCFWKWIGSTATPGNNHSSTEWHRTRTQPTTERLAERRKWTVQDQTKAVLCHIWLRASVHALMTKYWKLLSEPRHGFPVV